VLGHGVGAGIAIELPISEKWGAAFLIAPSVFPQASDRLDEHDYPTDRDPSLPGSRAARGRRCGFIRDVRLSERLAQLLERAQRRS